VTSYDLRHGLEVARDSQRRAVTQLCREERELIRIERDRIVREGIAVAPAVPRPPRKRKRSSRYGKTQKPRALVAVPFPELTLQQLSHPAYERIWRSMNPFSGLSYDELEKHVAGILRVTNDRS
jgi:hypothetical protein